MIPTMYQLTRRFRKAPLPAGDGRGPGGLRSSGILAALCALALVAPLAAQSDATLEGTVIDPQGRSVPGAEVLVRRVGTNAIRRVLTDNEGRRDNDFGQRRQGSVHCGNPDPLQRNSGRTRHAVYDWKIPVAIPDGP